MEMSVHMHVLSACVTLLECENWTNYHEQEIMQHTATVLLSKTLCSVLFLKPNCQCGFFYLLMSSFGSDLKSPHWQLNDVASRME